MNSADPIKPSITANAVASLIARAWSIMVQFLTIPLIAALLGPKAYGLVTLYATLVATLAFVDQGWASVIVREFPRLIRDASPRSAVEMRDLFRSIEIVSLSAAALIGTLIFASAPYIVRHWLNIDEMSDDQAVNAVRLMGLCILCQWPNNIYSSGFVALHRQAVLARITIVQATLSTGGITLLLWFIAARIEFVFVWQAVIWLLANFWLRLRLVDMFPSAEREGRFQLAALASVVRYGIGVTLIALTAVPLTQLDKLIVARYAPLDVFAAYSLSFTVASLVTVLVAAPIGSVLMPLLSRLFAARDDRKMAEEYHRWTQVIMFLAMPIGCVLVFFSKPFLEIWLGSGSPLIVPMVDVVPWIALGTLVSTAIMPVAILQLAAGWTRLLVIRNVITLPLYLIGLFVLVPSIGAIGGAYCWLVLNVGYLLLETPLVHRCLLKSELWRWWGMNILLPATITFAIFYASKMLILPSADRWFEIGHAGISAIGAYTALVTVLRYPRALLAEGLKRLPTIQL